MARSLDRSGVGLEHQVELAGFGELARVPHVRAQVGIVELVEAVPAPQLRQSTNGSVKLARCPDASQTGGRREDRGVESDDVVSFCTIDRHQASLTLRSISTPTGRSRRSDRKPP